MKTLLDTKKLNHTECVMYRTVSNDFTEEEAKEFDYDLCVFFSPSGINAFTIDYYAENTSVTPADSEPETYPNTPEKWYYVLPIASQDNYTIQVAAVTSDVKTAVVPAEYMSWNAGYEYTYKFKITEGGGIKLDIIQVGINDWVKKTPSYHTVYNW